ncbi:MAG TPA: 2'-5' RNA ligase family protein [Ktedonosporobacter sp.]|nr:2'-5' RNA ligase family protein [Ktedonosporobacter sp.]
MSILKYSLWLMPSGAVGRTFSQLIATLAQQYSSPVFPPHVTLIGSIVATEEEVMGKARELASLIHPYTMRLTNIDYLAFYYRALFVRVEPSEDVLAAYQQASKIFPSDQEADYMPHLSLLYGDFSVETKQAITQQIGASFSDEFEVNTLYLYRTEGAVSDWQQVSAFPLRPSFSYESLA